MLKKLFRIIKMHIHRNRMKKILNERINYTKPNRNIVALEKSLATPIHEDYGNSFDEGSPLSFER